MKLYTKTGDDGSTGLFGGQRVAKDCQRVEAYGTVDELNGHLGLAAVACHDRQMTDILITTQGRLFELGADLASPRPAASEADRTNRISSVHGIELERHIDAICEHLPPMKHFILPGGCELAARLHVARTVCRRAERLCVGLASLEPIGADIVIYLNRLSDLLFAMSRRANQLAGVDDVPWH